MAWAEGMVGRRLSNDPSLRSWPGFTMFSLERQCTVGFVSCCYRRGAEHCRYRDATVLCCCALLTAAAAIDFTQKHIPPPAFCVVLTSVDVVYQSCGINPQQLCATHASLTMSIRTAGFFAAELSGDFVLLIDGTRRHIQSTGFCYAGFVIL